MLYTTGAEAYDEVAVGRRLKQYEAEYPPGTTVKRFDVWKESKFPDDPPDAAIFVRYVEGRRAVALLEIERSKALDSDWRVKVVYTDSDFRRRGFASALFAAATEKFGPIANAAVLTADGLAWVNSLEGGTHGEGTTGPAARPGTPPGTGQPFGRGTLGPRNRFGKRDV